MPVVQFTTQVANASEQNRKFPFNCRGFLIGERLKWTKMQENPIFDYMGGFHKYEYPKFGWFLYGKILDMDHLRVALF